MSIELDDEDFCAVHWIEIIFWTSVLFYIDMVKELTNGDVSSYHTSFSFIHFF